MKKWKPTPAAPAPSTISDADWAKHTSGAAAHNPRVRGTGSQESRGWMRHNQQSRSAAARGEN